MDWLNYVELVKSYVATRVANIKTHLHLQLTIGVVRRTIQQMRTTSDSTTETQTTTIRIIPCQFLRLGLLE
jgi:hypothetical protein